FGGGVEVPPVLGSRATYLRGRLGGMRGRVLARDDAFRLGPTAPVRRRAVPAASRPQWGGETALRVVLGPQADRFTDEGVAAFLGSAYEVLPQSDRMGARLNGARIAHARGHDIISDGIALAPCRCRATVNPSCCWWIGNPRAATRRSPPCA